MIMENASLEIIPLHIFFWKGFGKYWYDIFGLVFHTVPFPIISQGLIFPVLGIKLSET